MILASALHFYFQQSRKSCGDERTDLQIQREVQIATLQSTVKEDGWKKSEYCQG